MLKQTKEILESIINDIDPNSDEYGHQATILDCLNPYSSEQKNAMIKSLEKVIEIIEEKIAE